MPMAIVWPTELDVEVYVAAGREVEVPGRTVRDATSRCRFGDGMSATSG